MLKQWRKSPFDAEKVFRIGLNKTGTTSLEKAFAELGYKMDNQNATHALLCEYETRIFPLSSIQLKSRRISGAPFRYCYLSIKQNLFSITKHKTHKTEIIKFFFNRLILNLADSNSYSEMCKFINKKPLYENFPWENKTTV